MTVTDKDVAASLQRLKSLESRLNSSLLSSTKHSSSSNINKSLILNNNRKQFKNNKTIEFFRNISRTRRKTDVLPSTVSSPVSSPQNFSIYNNEGDQSTTNYSPYSKELILEMVSTYSDYMNWSNDDLLAPIDCVLNGWKCMKNNRLKCVSCQRTLLIKFPDTEEEDEDNLNYEITKSLQKIHAKKLCTQHDSSCPWRLNPSKKFYSYDISTINEEYELNQLKKRYNNLLMSEKSFFNLKYPHIETKSIDLIKKWLNDEIINDQYLLISLCGWDLKANSRHNNKILFCDCCGLEVLTRPENEKSNEETSTIDLVNDHKSWCCYINGYLKFFDLIKDDLSYNDDSLSTFIESIKKH